MSSESNPEILKAADAKLATGVENLAKKLDKLQVGRNSQETTIDYSSTERNENRSKEELPFLHSIIFQDISFITNPLALLTTNKVTMSTDMTIEGLKQALLHEMQIRKKCEESLDHMRSEIMEQNHQTGHLEGSLRRAADKDSIDQKAKLTHLLFPAHQQSRAVSKAATANHEDTLKRVNILNEHGIEQREMFRKTMESGAQTVNDLTPAILEGASDPTKRRQDLRKLVQTLVDTRTAIVTEAQLDHDALKRTLNAEMRAHLAAGQLANEQGRVLRAISETMGVDLDKGVDEKRA